jgi:hypothetical protein
MPAGVVAFLSVGFAILHGFKRAEEAEGRGVQCIGRFSGRSFQRDATAWHATR